MFQAAAARQSSWRDADERYSSELVVECLCGLQANVPPTPGLYVEPPDTTE